MTCLRVINDQIGAFHMTWLRVIQDMSSLDVHEPAHDKPSLDIHV
jgi:hypothetical protein